MITHTFFFAMHITSLLLAVIGIVYADRVGLAWIRGKIEVITHETLVRVHLIVWVALLLLIVSGLFLFWPLKSFLLHQGTFYLKMAFVLALVINSFVIEGLMHVAARQSFATLTRREQLPLFISGGVSVVSWIGAFTTAFFLFN